MPAHYFLPISAWGVNNSVSTHASGGGFTALPSILCDEVTIVNPGVAIDITCASTDAPGQFVTIAANSGITLNVVANAVSTAQNSGIFAAPNSAAETDTLTAGTSTTATVSGATWTTNQWAPFYMLYNTTKSTYTAILSNNGTVLTTATASPAHAVGDVIEIVKNYSWDGTHYVPWGYHKGSESIITAQIK
jgi:hypothetical protein